MQSAIMQQFVADQVSGALTRGGLPRDHPMRALLIEEAVVAGVRDACVRVSGGSVSLDDRVEQLKLDPRFGASVPDPPKVARGDIERMRANFNEIAAGTVVVR